MHIRMPLATASMSKMILTIPAARFKITPQVLPKWHSTMLGELMVPDRFVDVFQGRAPRNILARHYTGKGLERLMRIYDKAGLKILR